LNREYVLDACALIALLTGEDGAQTVRAILNEACVGEMKIRMNKLNLLEVYYDAYRSYGKKVADETLDKIKKLPIAIVSEISDAVFAEAGRLKVSYKISLADSIALAETFVSGGILVTSDHHEFDVIDQSDNIEFYWIR
jgi:predicted nucleic acid-binding protein